MSYKVPSIPLARGYLSNFIQPFFLDEHNQELQQIAQRHSTYLEIRCSTCLKLHPSDSFPTHPCQPPTDLELQHFRTLKHKRTNPPHQNDQVNLFIADLQETPSPKGITYTLHIQAQSTNSGLIYNATPLTRSYAEVLGFITKVAKQEKENEVGRNAGEVLKHLMDQKGQEMGRDNGKAQESGRQQEVRRISIQHLMNEVLASGSAEGSGPISAFFEVKEVKRRVIEKM